MDLTSTYKISAGLIIIKSKKVLLVKPSIIDKNYSFPKGEVNENETFIDAAIRETFEETGIRISPNEVDKNPFVIDYINCGILTKKVYLYFYTRNMLDLPDILPEEMLQRNEIEHAEFVNFNFAIVNIFWRFRKVIFDLSELQKID